MQYANGLAGFSDATGNQGFLGEHKLAASNSSHLDALRHQSFDSRFYGFESRSSEVMPREVAHFTQTPSYSATIKEREAGESIRPLDNFPQYGTGVYVGFKPSMGPWDPSTHVFLWFKHDNGGYGVIEAGPDTGGPSNGKLDLQLGYHDGPNSASYGFTKVNPPPGVSDQNFSLAIESSGNLYGLDVYSAPAGAPTYSIIGANCENFASGILRANGIGQAELNRLSSTEIFGALDPYFANPAFSIVTPMTIAKYVLNGAILNGAYGPGHTGQGSPGEGGGIQPSGSTFLPLYINTNKVFFNGVQVYPPLP